MQQIINLHKLKELYDKPESADEIISLFIKTAPEFLLQLEVAINDRNKGIVEQLCHKAIGRARYIASDLIEDQLKQIQASSYNEQCNYLFQLKETISTLKHAHKT